MELSERMQVERYELGSATEDAALRTKDTIAVPLLTLTLGAIAALLAIATAQAFDGWPHLIVIAAIVTTAIGLMIAVSPARRG